MWKQTLSTIACLTFASQSAWSAAGTLDPTFGNGGISITNFGNDIEPSAVTLDAAGDIVVAATITNVGGSLIRYLPDGTLDPSFGSDGLVTGIRGQTAGLTIQPDGKIVLEVSSDLSGSALIRFNPNGTLDTSFADNGQLLLSYPSPALYFSTPSAVLLEPNGDLLVLFSVRPKSYRSTLPELTALARYTSSGALDPSFGTGGDSAAVSLGASMGMTALLSNGDVLVTSAPTATLSPVLVTAEFSSAGALLPAVSAGPVVTSAFSSTLLPAPVVEPSSDLLFLGHVKGPLGKSDFDSEVVRYLADGSVDPTFPPVVFDFSPNSNSGSDAWALALTPDGKIVVVGTFSDPTNTQRNGEFAVARLGSGSLDTTFGNGGIATTVSGGQAQATVVQGDGKIIAVGRQAVGNSVEIPGNLAIVRYLGQ